MGLARGKGLTPPVGPRARAGGHSVTARRRVSSNSPYEPLIGFSRAVRVSDTVYVSGTVAWGPDGKLVGPGDVYAQAKQAIANIEAALKEAGAALRGVVGTRVY